MNQNRIVNFGIYLVYFTPILILTGPFLSGLALSIVSIISLYLIFFKKKNYFIKNKFSLIIILWLLYLILRSLFSDNVYLSLESSLFYARFYFYSLFIYYAITEIRNFNSRYINILFITLSITIIDSFIQLFFGKNILGFEYSLYRLSSFFGEEKILGSYISKLLFCLTGIYFISNLRNNSKYLLILLLFIFLGSIMILYSGERTALFNFTIFLIFLFYTIYKKDKKLFLISSFFLFLISLLILFSPSIKTRMINTTYDQIFSSNSDENIKLYSIHHQVMYSAAFAMFNDNKLLGIGPKLYRENCKLKKYNIEATEIVVNKDNGEKSMIIHNSCSTHPHNFLIQLLAETGLMGTIPIIVFYFFLIYWFFKVRNYKFIVLAIILNFNPLIPSGNFFGNSVNILMYLPIGFLIASFYKK